MNPHTKSRLPLAKPTNNRPHKGQRERPLPESFHLVVKCRNEREQRTLYERLTAAGHHCRVLSL